MITGDNLFKIFQVVPEWAAGIGFVLLCLAFFVSLPFAFRQMSLVDWFRSKVLKQEIASPHASCPHNGEARRHAELYGEWKEIRASWRDVYLRECMDTGERILEKMAVELKDRYRIELQAHTEINNGAKAADYDAFAMVIERWRLEMRDRFRGYARENGYYAMSHEDWAQYLDTKPAAMMSNASDVFDIFHRSCIVPRSRLRELTKDYQKEIFQLTVSCFVYARSRSIHYLELRRKKYELWADMHKKLYGISPIEGFE